ncbi:5-methylcytosine-specific restriction system specificity protein McrC [Synergistales bacterium]|nr:5-methylcytosine-specific restriction system specificity protein McrC [Synergistales bacterium]
MHRDYIQREEALAGLRGQIRVADTIKQQTLPQGKLVCVYDEFSPNSPHNQVLKSVMLLLLRRREVKPENKQKLRKLLLSYFSEITEIAPRAIRWDALKYHRNNASYQMLIGICSLVVDDSLQTTEAGENKLTKWLPDEKMHQLYERFVRAYYERHHPEFSPRKKQIAWNLTNGASDEGLPKMETDITLRFGEKTLIIDTKWYSKTMQTRYEGGNLKYIPHNLYQIFTYVKNEDKDCTGNAAGVLLYAKTDENVTPDADFNIGGNRISLKTLDLNQEWDTIESQLEKLCELLTG